MEKKKVLEKQRIWRYGFAFLVLVAGVLLNLFRVGNEFLGFGSVGSWLIYIAFVMFTVITLQIFSKRKRIVDERAQFVAMKASRITFLAIVLAAFGIMIADGIKTIYLPYSYFMSYWIAGIVFVYFVAYKILDKKY